jgi:uncharacterized integral membrane protein
MLTIALVVTFGIIFSIFATQNTGTIDLYFYDYQLSDVPLYLVTLVSVSIGVLIVGIYYTLHTLAMQITISDKDKKISDYKKEITSLTKEIHTLELENTKLKARLDNEENFDDQSL